MREYLKTVRIEAVKFKSRGLLLTWTIVTAALVALMLYEGRNGISSSRITYESLNTYYYSVETEIVMIFGLALPPLSSVIASKLIDEETLHNTWILLSSSNQNLGKLFDVKFLITYVLVELTSAIVYIAATAELYLLSRLPVPLMSLMGSFLALSMVNFYVVVTVFTAALYSSNQIVPIVTGILLGIVGVVSPLLPPEIDRFIPFAYYTFCMLSGNRITGYEEGLATWFCYDLEPDYVLIAAVFVLFVVAFLIVRYRFIRREI